MDKLQKVQEALEYYASKANNQHNYKSLMEIDDTVKAKEALAELKELKEGEGWQPIETAPKDESFILAYFPGGIGVEKVYFEKETGQFETLRSEFNVKPTHWLRLPKGPSSNQCD
jgi:hypothetical protein